MERACSLLHVDASVDRGKKDGRLGRHAHVRRRLDATSLDRKGDGKTPVPRAGRDAPYLFVACLRDWV
jgi:hypothetical protein